MDSDEISTFPSVVVRQGRHVGWWVDGWRRDGRRVAWTWWPFERLARWFARWLRRLINAPIVDPPT